MPLQITNPALEQKVMELAAVRHESIDETLSAALAQLERGTVATKRKRPTVEETLALIRSYPPTSIDYSMSDDQILGFHENGLPD